ncbi:MAG: penicillin acylase family protein [Chitinophagales bacterium]|nr:penicillin acylase family protein [Chitinophagales bacterium]
MIKRFLGVIIAFLTAIMIFFLNKPSSTPAIGYLLSPTHGFWNNIEIRPQQDKEIKIKGPTGRNVSIIIDDRRVPHIFAENEEDLYFAQGYMIAKERLWQMHFVTLAASGRLSEVVGDKTLQLDRYNRRIGMKDAAEKAVAALSKDPETRMLVESYCAGVNHWIASLSSKDLPIEYKLMGFAPEKFSPLNCALLLKYMANDLTGSDYDLQNSNALRLFGRENFDLMYPDFPQDLDPIIPKGNTWSFKYTLNQADSLVASGAYENPYESFRPAKGIGSNNWTVGGAKTASGKPLLCNDPHLALSLPSIWFEMQLNAPGINVYGVTLPGSPGIVIGFNEYIAWGVTNGSMDVRDWYQVEYTADESAYKFGDTILPFENKVQVFKVKGKPDVIDTVKYTKAGPIIYDEKLTGVKDQQHLALHWEAFNVSNELKCFYLLNHAKQHEDYLKALTFFACPGQNFVYADRYNNIAIKEQGRFPLRNANEGGKFVTPLAQLNPADLTSYIPMEKNPYVLNPERGFCSSANQHPTDQSYPYYYTGDYEKYRNRRINNVLSGLNKATVNDMQLLQNDNYSLVAAENLPYMMAQLNDSALDKSGKEILTALKTWNFMADHNLKQPSYFYKWMAFLMRDTWDEVLSANPLTMRLPDEYQTTWLMRNKPTFPLFDNATTPTVEHAQQIIQQSFKEMVDFFGNNYTSDTIKWQYYKNTTIAHLAQIPAFSEHQVPVGGYATIVNACTETWGPSWRMVVDFKDGRPKGYGIFPGGQSGNPGSPYYSNMIADWAKGKYYNLLFWSDKAEAIAYLKK